MAQKKAVAAKGKKAANRVEKLREEEENVVAQSPSKKSRKQPVKEVPPSSEEESDAEAQNDEQVDDSDSEAEDLLDHEAEEDEEDDSEEEEDDEEDVEPGEVSNSAAAEEEDDSDDDDEAPVEEPVSKKGKDAKKPGKPSTDEADKKTGIPKVRFGKIPPETPKNAIIYATNLPKEYKNQELIALFAKFGPISAVNKFSSKNGINSVLLAFDTPAAAEAVLQAKPKALTLGNKALIISQPKDKDALNERTVVVSLFGPKVTIEDLKAFFEKVAPVESVTLSANRLNPKAFVRLVSVDDIPKVLKLHSTELYSRFITVQPISAKALKTAELTLVVENLGKHESYSANALEKIFKKFGELDNLDVVCSKTVLAFVTFKQAEAATKALDQLQGKTVNNLELKLLRFERSTSGKTILVTNLTTDTTEADLRNVFNESGDIESVQMLKNKAVVKFTTDDAFCKSFLNNEKIVNNVPIFIEPNSLLKHRLSRKRAAIAKSHAPAKFQKIGNNKFGKKPFNKRPAHENGGTPFVKRAKF
ncbi:DNA-binding protein modulo [Drosophila biarmipes]|uniref:DNA-binding protein modulo n=1 Tax=Drosophila biarmipes TaxID=125945 RepID=UPI0007E83B5E|nr:DNA-binding protein modulo [Drosophila biarmipes]